MKRATVVIGFLGTTLDAGRGSHRWERWRPTVAICQQEDLVVDRLELLYPPGARKLCDEIVGDLRTVSPETQVRLHEFPAKDPWDFELVYANLHNVVRGLTFQPEKEDYLVHITTGTHVAQICLYLLTESRRIPGRLLQSSPDLRGKRPVGHVRVIDLDLSQYDALAARFVREHTDRIVGLKSGIPTRNVAFNQLIEELEQVAANTMDPILITGPTGAGKTLLAKRLYELKRHLHQVKGQLVEVNCATLRGDTAMSTLFGHRKGAFTGAIADRPGLLRTADGGILFLDEIGELGLDEQAMLLRALEEKRFLPVGSDAEASSSFMLIAGTNRDLSQSVGEGTFREDLLARINLWTFCLPPLKDRREDIEPNVDYELEQFARRTNRVVRFSREAREQYLAFATSSAAAWRGNFRDLSASITRMATLAQGARIAIADVEREFHRLKATPLTLTAPDLLTGLLRPAALDGLDLFDRVQLEQVVRTCRQSASLAEAGRALFAASRSRRASVNDSDRLRKYLARFDLDWDLVAPSRS
ncbi:MAG: RNA repair transcriptional activator RtcR [Planctomycetota bacterium]|nr:RNA repair transcriptional activator RtcR [Planctomycetota bacterium]